MRRLRQQDRLISPRTFVNGVVAHTVACLGLGLLYSLETLALYCGLLLMLIGLSHLPTLQSEAHVRMRMAEAEIAKLLRLLEAKPQHGPMHFALGDAYTDYRQYDKAIAEYELAAQLDPAAQRAVKGKIKNARLSKMLLEQTWRIRPLMELPEEGPR